MTPPQQSRIAGASESVLPRILIVDDETAQMKALCNTLGDNGYDTTGFNNGKEALAALKERDFDLLLADLMMPELDGIQLLKAALEINPLLVGIIMTGQGTIDTAVSAMKTGALDYILKPFKLSAILPVLSRALAVRKLRVENIRLQQRVRERTEELEAANRELEAFSHSVSHDLQAPLRAVNGFTGMVLKRFSDQIPADALRLLKQVEKSTQHMSTLIEELLRFSRLGRQPIAKRRVNVAAVAREIVDGLLKDAGERKIEVRIGEIPDCQADEPLLRQVFFNLISNAFKFTRDKEAVVEIGCETGANELVYFVKDNGAGFDMDYAHKLFTVFQRLHSAAEFEGTGVGLSIVQRIVQKHGGRVWAQGKVGEGATFYVSLPAESSV